MKGTIANQKNSKNKYSDLIRISHKQQRIVFGAHYSVFC